MLKIAHIDTGQRLGGGQWQLLLLARQLRTRGHEQWIACPQGSALELRAREEGFHVRTLPAHDPGHVRGAFQLRRILKTDRLDIVHAHDGRGQSIAWISSARTGVRRVASRRVTFLPRWRTLHRLKYRYTCDAVIAVSNYVKGLLLGCGVPGGMIEVIYDGIVIPERLPDAEKRAAARRKWGFSDRDFVIGSLGAFRPGKGQETAVQAAGLVRARDEIKWLFTVDPCSAPETRRFPMLIGSRHFRAVHAPEDPSEFLSALDLYVMPSPAEGLGSSALLAMAHGLPVAASRAGGLPEIVQDGKTGWLFAPGSAPELAEVVVRALQDSEERQRFGVNASCLAREFSDVIMASRTEALYLKLCAGLQ
ncbi:MAG: glycosyltransferase family 4 protein [Terriglobia bacterium]